MPSQDSGTTLTVDRIYDEPNLSGISISSISWRPDGRSVSYLRGEADRNEIWGFDIGASKPQRLFSYSRLAGPARPHRGPINKRHPTYRHDWRQRRIRSAETLTYLWAPRGDMLLVAAAAGAPSLLDLKTDRLYPLTHDAQPVYDIHWSPNGRFVSFVRAFDLFLIDAVTGRELPVTCGSSEPLRSATPDTMGDLLSDAGHWWSPDSQRIAYLQTDERAVDLFAFPDLLSSSGASQWERYPRPGRPNPTIAVKVASARGHIWIDTRAWPGCYLARVAWLPDSRHLALQMLNREQNELSLVLADAQTGATRPILTDKAATWVNVSDDLRFFADGRRFLWTSEKDSYRHLYIHETDGGRQLAQLTSGAEASVAVEGLDERHGAAYYLVFPEPHTEGRLKRVTFRLAADGFKAGKASELTPTPGTHFAHLSPDFQYFADIWSSALRPPRLNLHAADGRHLATIEENRCDELSGFRLSGFDFRAIPAAKIGDPSDGMPLYSKLLTPTTLESGRKYPVIVYVYGGPLPGGFGLARNVLNYWRPVPELWMQMMAQRGFGIFSLDNRGSNAAPRGHAWEAPIYQRLGEVELADQLEGIKYLKSLEWVDPDRIGILGGSFGGFMALNAMLRAPGTFKAGIAFAPVTNWSEYDSVYTERYMNLPARNPRGYRKTALTGHAPDLAGKLLLLHGTGDDNVHLQHSIQLIDALIQASENFGMMLYPGQSHMSFFGMGQDPTRLWARITAFFVKNLAALFVVVALAGMVSACTAQAPAPRPDSASPAAAPSRTSGATPFRAKLSCAIPGRGAPTEATAVAWRVGPPPPAPCAGEACRTLIMTQEHCTWDGFAIGGQAVVTSLMHGQGYMQGTGGNASGYDWGTVANGDSYLSRWTEALSPGGISGTWTVVFGTGSLQGLTGNATIDCAPPGQSDTVEVCNVAGAYTLPR